MMTPPGFLRALHSLAVLCEMCDLDLCPCFSCEMLVLRLKRVASR